MQVKREKSAGRHMEDLAEKENVSERGQTMLALPLGPCGVANPELLRGLNRAQAPPRPPEPEIPRDQCLRLKGLGAGGRGGI